MFYKCQRGFKWLVGSCFLVSWMLNIWRAGLSCRVWLAAAADAMRSICQQRAPQTGPDDG